MGIGVTEILIVLVVLVLLFGASRLPGLGKDLGSGIRNFKDGLLGTGAEQRSEPDGEVATTRPRKAKRHRPRSISG